MVSQGVHHKAQTKETIRDRIWMNFMGQGNLGGALSGGRFSTCFFAAFTYARHQRKTACGGCDDTKQQCICSASFSLWARFF
jgi:hypothetical protein